MLRKIFSREKERHGPDNEEVNRSSLTTGAMQENRRQQILPPHEASSNTANTSATTTTTTTTAASTTGTGTVQSSGSFHDAYELLAMLRSGSFGTVYTCRLKDKQSNEQQKPEKEATIEDSEKYAVKIIDCLKFKNYEKDYNAVKREVHVLQKLNNFPNVIQFLAYFEEGGLDMNDTKKKKLYVVQQYAAGGDVFDALRKRRVYTERDARNLSKVLLQAMYHVHHHAPGYCIVHRDLKPENLLLKCPMPSTGAPYDKPNSDDDEEMENYNDGICNNLLLADFGFAKILRTGDDMKDWCSTRCGTPAFVAPEIVVGTLYREQVDLWSVGCIIYMLLSGFPPFHGKNHRDLFYQIRSADYVFHERYFKNVSTEAKVLISGLLTVNPDKRWTTASALECDWFVNANAKKLSSTDLSGSIRCVGDNWTVKDNSGFDAKARWKKAAHAVGFVSTAPFWNLDTVTFSQQMKEWDKQVLLKQQNQPAGAAQKNPEESGKGTGNPITSKIQSLTFSDVYDLKTTLRKGSSATVYECQHKMSKQVFAVKIIDRARLNPSDDESVLNEVSMMQSLTGNKYVVQLLDFYEEPESFYIVMEYMTGGDVFDRIVQCTQYTEKDARDLCATLLRAIASVHQAGIAHRDIKPQNLLLRSQEDNASVVLTDFGFARRVHTPNSLTDRVGTPTYVAPEILKNIPHDDKSDLWSIGVVAYILLVGYPPFLEDSQQELFRKIRTGTWKFDERDWKHISTDAQDLIEGLLKIDPKERWSVKEALGCPWIQQDPNQLSSVNLVDSINALKERRQSLRNQAKAYLFRTAGKDGENEQTETVEVVTQAQEYQR